MIFKFNIYSLALKPSNKTKNFLIVFSPKRLIKKHKKTHTHLNKLYWVFYLQIFPETNKKIFITSLRLFYHIKKFKLFQN